MNSGITLLFGCCPTFSRTAAASNQIQLLLINILTVMLAAARIKRLSLCSFYMHGLCRLRNPYVYVLLKGTVSRDAKLVLVLGDLFGRSCRKSRVDSPQVVIFTLSCFAYCKNELTYQTMVSHFGDLSISCSDWGWSFQCVNFGLYNGSYPPILFKIYPMPLQQCS